MESVSGKKAARHLADYFSFNAYVLTVLHYINLNHPESERVDFVVDRNEGVFEKLKQFYDTFEKWTRAYRSPGLAKYLGELIPAGKERVSVQAADILCWHASRHDFGLLKGRDAMRAAVMFNRKKKIIPLTDELHAKLARAFTEKLNELEELNEKNSEFENFDRTMHKLIKEPHSEIRAALDAERAETQRKREAKNLPLRSG
jgi:hypothetical protein